LIARYESLEGVFALRDLFIIFKAGLQPLGDTTVGGLDIIQTMQVRVATDDATESSSVIFEVEASG